MSLSIVSFYSDVDGSRYYSTCAARLTSQCDRLGIAHHIVERHYGDGWIANVKAKPTFLLEMYEQLGEPFLWVDADCEVLQYPHAAEALVCEWACIPNATEGLSVCDCVHLVGRSARTRSLLEAWSDRCADSDTRGSHSAFCAVLPSAVSEGLHIAYLPRSYVEGPVIRIGLAKTPSKADYLKAITCR